MITSIGLLLTLSNIILVSNTFNEYNPVNKIAKRQGSFYDGYNTGGHQANNNQKFHGDNNGKRDASQNVRRQDYHGGINIGGKQANNNENLYGNDNGKRDSKEMFGGFNSGGNQANGNSDFNGSGKGKRHENVSVKRMCN